MHRSIFAYGICALLVVWNIPSASAAPLLLNGSFETPALATGKALIGPTGDVWTYTHPAGVINPPGEPIPNQGDYGGYAAPDGAQYGFIQSGHNERGSISQQIILAAGQYRLSFLEAGRALGPFGPGVGGNQPYSITLSGTNLATFASTTGETFTGRTVDFTAVAGTYALTFAAGGSLTSDNTTFLDKVVLTSVPEPATLAGFAFGCMALIRPRRKASK